MKFYRYDYTVYGSIYDDSYYDLPLNPDVRVHCQEFNLIKETDKGYWIRGEYWGKDKKWVSKTAKKRYAYPTKKEALTSFIKRTQRRIDYLKYDIRKSEIALLRANNEKID